LGCGCGDQNSSSTSRTAVNQTDIVSSTDPIVCTKTISEVVTEFAEVDIIPEINVVNIITTCIGPLHIGGTIPPGLPTFCPIVLSQEICVQFEVQFGVTTSSTTAIKCGSPVEGLCPTTPTFTCCAAVQTNGAQQLGAITITEDGSTVTGTSADINIHVCFPANNCKPEGSAFQFHFNSDDPTQHVSMEINEQQIESETCNADGSVDIKGTGIVDIGGTMTTVNYTLHVTTTDFTLVATNAAFPFNTVLEVGAPVPPSTSPTPITVPNGITIADCSVG
jgi:hypothetical protein